METLIDNRIFPEEMHEQPNPTEKKKKKSGSNFLIIFLLLIILALTYYILVHKKPTPVSEPKTFEEKQTLVVEQLEKESLQMTEDERIQRVNAFFNDQ